MAQRMVRGFFNEALLGRYLRSGLVRFLLPSVADPAPYDLLAIAAPRIRSHEQYMC
jgi:hypothetical protein